MRLISISLHVYKQSDQSSVDSRIFDEDDCFCNEALSEHLKEYKPQLISMYMYSNSTITVTIGALIGIRALIGMRVLMQ